VAVSRWAKEFFQKLRRELVIWWRKMITMEME
jgi:hypothetical protein